MPKELDEIHLIYELEIKLWLMLVLRIVFFFSNIKHTLLKLLYFFLVKTF